jgi:hypothetical protein
VRTWDVFFPDVLPEVLGCPEPTVERALLRAAQEWCEKTRCWRVDLDAITLIADTADYDVAYPTQAEGVQFVGATINGNDIELETLEGTTTAERRRGTGGSRRILSHDQRIVTVIPTPAAAGTLVITAVLKPSESATGVPNDIADRFREEIATGALARLLMANKTEWSNAGLAEAKAAKFQKRIGDVRKAMWKAWTNSRPRAVPMYY